MVVETPRDRNGSSEPQILSKHQPHFDGFDDRILSMYARGMSTREIQWHLKEIWGGGEPSLISDLTDAVVEELKTWQNRPLEPPYGVMYLDALYVKMRHEGRMKIGQCTSRSHRLGRVKDVLGLWSSGNEGAKFWLSVQTELKNRRVKDVLIVRVDGLKGFRRRSRQYFRTRGCSCAS